jgi:nucleotide-binding universal stress UspA family protein
MPRPLLERFRYTGRARTAGAAWHIGSVATQVLCQADVPVTLIK